VKTLYIPCSSKKDAIPSVKKALKDLREFKRIGLITTSQHLNQLDAVKKLLEKEGFEAVICGQVLGCNQSKAKSSEDKVDAFLFIGSGRFHPLGVAMKTNKKVVLCNPYSGESDEISDVEKGEWKKKQKKRLMRAAPAEVFGVLVSTKQGQFHLERAMELKEKIEKFGRKAFLFAGESITPPNTLGFDVGAWVNTACPRLVDDYFEKPVINPDELEILI
jgi:2-(3-amino-3-carboxypropyl)histidine synthase